LPARDALVSFGDSGEVRSSDRRVVSRGAPLAVSLLGVPA
jgi:hypothetical protein